LVKLPLGGDKLAELYDDIGIRYDTTRKADLELTRRILNHLQIFDEQKVIDLACGSGNYTAALSNLGVNISGVDISEEMIKKAKQKSEKINWYHADIANLPFQYSEFTGAICTLAIHHFQDLQKIFKEINRILKVGSRLVIFTSSPEQMANYWLNEYFPKMMKKSIIQMPKIETVSEALENNGFHIVGYETFMIQPDLQDFFLYSGKYKPEIYIKSEVRDGISSFAALASREEIENGVKNLELDIRNGSFRDKTSKYVSRLGDYMFVIAEKRDA
jgi:SAM-dependent methyltransferase